MFSIISRIRNAYQFSRFQSIYFSYWSFIFYKKCIQKSEYYQKLKMTNIGINIVCNNKSFVSLVYKVRTLCTRAINTQVIMYFLYIEQVLPLIISTCYSSAYNTALRVYYFYSCRIYIDLLTIRCPLNPLLPKRTHGSCFKQWYSYRITI